MSESSGTCRRVRTVFIAGKFINHKHIMITLDAQCILIQRSTLCCYDFQELVPPTVSLSISMVGCPTPTGTL